MTDTPKYDPTGGRAGRDAGIDQVMQGEQHWSIRVKALVLRLPHGWKGIGEDIRVMAAQRGYPMPHHWNAWGGFIAQCIKDGSLVKTGGLRHMRVAKSHARISQELMRP
jgi:hypothetical protein